LKQDSRSPEVTRALEAILRNANHQTQLINDITDLSRGLGGKLVLDDQLVDARAELDEAVDAVRLSADARGIRLQLVIPETPLVVRGEARRVRQIFWNLLTNAIKFNSPGGSVQATAERRNGSVIVRIVDTGQGIGPEFLPFVFDSFRQEDASKKRSHGGLGLGLAIVRHLTEAHGGDVMAGSPGLG